MSTILEQTTLVQPRKAVLAMPEYHPPLAGRDALRLDFNENTFSPSPSVLRRLQQLTAEGLTIYPEREPVERIVARHFGLERDQLLLTNGVSQFCVGQMTRRRRCRRYEKSTLPSPEQVLARRLDSDLEHMNTRG